MLKFNTTKVNNDKVCVVLNQVSYKDLLLNDIAVIESIDIEELKANAMIEFGASESDVLDALNGDGSVRGRKGLLTSLKQSLDGANTDHHPNPNLQAHPSLKGASIDTITNFVYVSGLVVSETMQEEGAVKTPKKEVKSGIVVQLKNWIEYSYKLQSCKYRMYKCDSNTQFEQV